MMDAPRLLGGLTRLKGSRLHLGVSGSVSAYKAAELLRALLACGVSVTVTPTEGAKRFVTPLLFESLGAARVYPELFSGEDPFAHLEPGEGAQALLVAPASASLIARAAAGLATDMLSAQILAFSGPMAVAPAMNPRMWANPATRDNVLRLKERGVAVVGPEEGKVACGAHGPGRLASLPVLLCHALRLLAPKDMAGERVLVTLGPTREHWDLVRFWSNPSSGTMGTCLALCAWMRGARVTAVAGPGVDSSLLPALPGLERVPVETARDMLEACEAAWDGATMGMFSAAVADFSPKPLGSVKFKKETSPDGFGVDFVPNPDILKTLAARKGARRILGFAAEAAGSDAELGRLARIKLERKGADVIAANRIDAECCGFGSPTNAMSVVAKDGREAFWPLESKADAAWDLCTWLSRA